MASILIFLACAKNDPKEVACDACGGDCAADQLPDRGNTHTTNPVNYEDHPPASGNHNPCWASWGVHTDVVPPENWVHNLEHGAVVFLWNCPDGCDEDRAALENWSATLPPARFLVAEYDDMDWKFAAVSWQNRLMSNCLDLTAMSAFFDSHVGQAPENSMDPPGSGCM